jgi:membrane fusion protein (multidrug efflux system)
MRGLALILSVAAAVLLMLPASAQDNGEASSAEETEKSTDKVKELRRERIAALQAMAEIETSLYQKGKTSLEEVQEAKVLVCEAELDAAEKESDRIALLQNLVEVLKQYEELAKVRKQTARGTEAAVLKARARRLEAEIRLEQARQQDPGQASIAEPQHKVVVVSPQTKDVVITQQFAGEIRARRHIDVRSLQSGYLEEVLVKEGQTVKKGDVLFKIASDVYQARLDAARAEVEIAALNLKTKEKLFEKKYVSEDELSIEKAKLAGAKAKADVAAAELNLTVVRAPFDGIIARLQQQEGSLITPENVLTTLCDNSEMWVYFQVPQASYLEYMAKAGKDHKAEIELLLADGGKLPQPGKIAAIEAQFDSQTGTVPFRADFPNPEGVLRHGMAGTVSVGQTSNAAIVIPQRATFEMLGKRYVYVVDKDDVAHRREIVVQTELADTFVIKRGLDVNDKIVLEGMRQIYDGEKLTYELREQ